MKSNFCWDASLQWVVMRKPALRCCFLVTFGSVDAKIKFFFKFVFPEVNVEWVLLYSLNLFVWLYGGHNKLVKFVDLHMLAVLAFLLSWRLPFIWYLTPRVFRFLQFSYILRRLLLDSNCAVSLKQPILSIFVILWMAPFKFLGLWQAVMLQKF